MENKNKQEEGSEPLQLSLGSRLLLDGLLVELIQEGTVQLDGRGTLELETVERKKIMLAMLG